MRPSSEGIPYESTPPESHRRKHKRPSPQRAKPGATVLHRSGRYPRLLWSCPLPAPNNGPPIFPSLRRELPNDPPPRPYRGAPRSAPPPESPSESGVHGLWIGIPQNHFSMILWTHWRGMPTHQNRESQAQPHRSSIPTDVPPLTDPRAPSSGTQAPSRAQSAPHGRSFSAALPKGSPDLDCCLLSQQASPSPHATNHGKGPMRYWPLPTPGRPRAHVRLFPLPQKDHRRRGQSSSGRTPLKRTARPAFPRDPRLEECPHLHKAGKLAQPASRIHPHRPACGSRCFATDGSTEAER